MIGILDYKLNYQKNIKHCHATTKADNIMIVVNCLKYSYVLCVRTVCKLPRRMNTSTVVNNSSSRNIIYSNDIIVLFNKKNNIK